MRFTFRELDQITRDQMVAEITDAIQTGTLYYSKRFTAVGREAWPGLLLQAAGSHDEHWLAWRLEAVGAMTDFETKGKPSGGYTVAHVPHTAAETFADAEFNRYYMCAICRRAIAEGKTAVTVYRAKQRGEPRPESQAIIGTSYDPASLVLQLRPLPSGAPHPLLKANSGLSVHT